MGKREMKMKSTESDEESSLEERKRFYAAGDNASDDDIEANEDLSLKIVQKAMSRGCINNSPRKGAEAGEAAAAIVTNLKDEVRKKSKKKKSKKIEAQEDTAPVEIDSGFKEFCSDLFPVDVENEEVKVEADKSLEIATNSVETNPVEKDDNIVLRRLLRGPRYFDPPDSSWGTCYNCGEEGHTTANCTSAKRRRPCFVCGSLEHNAKQCIKAQDCFICKKGGHRAKDCPEKKKRESQSSKICLKCGESGHDMFSCRSDYCADDLKEIQCYICGSFGHLCCVDYGNDGPREVSCYRCGLSGHTGLACRGSRGEMGVSYHSCYKCGEEGHFARECPKSSNKVGKRNRELSTPKKRSFKEKRENVEFRSAPHDFGKGRKKKSHDEVGFRSATKSKPRGGWITDPEDLFLGKAAASSWRSPATPSNKKARVNNGTPSGRSTLSYSVKRSGKLNFSNSDSKGSSKFYQRRSFASRFGNNMNDSRRWNYE